MRFIGFLVSFIFILLSIFLCADWHMEETMIFFDWSTLFGIIGVLAGITIGTGNFKTLIMGINGALSANYKMTDEQREKCVTFFKLARKTVWYSGVMMVFIALAMLLLNLDDPGTMGPKVGVAFFSVVWSTAINLLLINPAIYMLMQKNTEESPEPKRTRPRGILGTAINDKAAAEKLLQLCYIKGITHDEIMEALEITLR